MTGRGSRDRRGAASQRGDRHSGGHHNRARRIAKLSKKVLHDSLLILLETRVAAPGGAPHTGLRLIPSIAFTTKAFHPVPPRSAGRHTATTSRPAPWAARPKRCPPSAQADTAARRLMAAIVASTCDSAAISNIGASLVL